MKTRHRNRWTLVLFTVLCMGTMSASPLISSDLAQTDERLEKLSADQKNSPRACCNLCRTWIRSILHGLTS